jgi:hypothetical protein
MAERVVVCECGERMRYKGVGRPPCRCGECKRRLREANKAEIAAKKREYREANKAEIAAKQREYREANKAEIAAKKREREGRSCSNCGESMRHSNASGLCGFCESELQEAA